jgi:hypothetical protein
MAPKEFPFLTPHVKPFKKISQKPQSPLKPKKPPTIAQSTMNPSTKKLSTIALSTK